MTCMMLTTAFDEQLVTVLKSGGVAILRTDTLYGIVARADAVEAVERVYTIKGRTPTKSPIVLIARLEDMFDDYTERKLNNVTNVWPGKNSIILPSAQAPDWIMRGNASVAYRMPANDALRQLLARTGPLIAPSANPEGLPPAMTIDKAVQYFDDSIDIYVDGGEVVDDTPSKLFRVTNEGLERLR